MDKMFNKVQERIEVVRIKDKPLTESEVNEITKQLIFSESKIEEPLKNGSSSLSESLTIAAICIFIPLLVGTVGVMMSAYMGSKTVVDRAVTTSGNMKYVSGNKMLRTIKKYLGKSEYADAKSSYKSLIYKVSINPKLLSTEYKLQMDKETTPYIEKINKLYAKALKLKNKEVD